VAAKGKVARCYSGPLDAPFIDDMVHCKSTKSSSNNINGGPGGSSSSSCKFIMHVTKLYSSSDGNSFDAFGRIYSGTCRPGDRVKVLGEGYVPHEDDEDRAVATIEAIWIPRGRTRTQVTLATAGNWVLLSGVDATISKTATLVGMDSNYINSSGGHHHHDDDDDDNDGHDKDPVHIFSPLSFPSAGGESTMKIALEPLNPADLPKMVEGLRRVGKAYPMVRTRVEESGEHVLFGTGELYMDCVLHDLRHVYADVEIKVADPIVAFRETVIDTSSLKCFAETANKRNKLTFISEPLDEGLADRLELGKVKIHEWDQRKTGRFFQSQYGWDLLSSRSVWAFGDSPTHGTNILLDDTLPSEVDKTLLESCRSSIVQGFQWATREGPLCEEPVRGTKIKILEVVLSDKPIYRGGGQIIPTARRTVHSSILTATPRLMEPIYRLQIQCPGELVESIQPILKRRRGHIVQDRPIPGTLLYSVRGFLPVLDSFGFETDLRTFTQGQAMVHSVFDHWAVVPGDPLDKTIMLHPLEPSPPQFLARELLLKTRRRKGLSEDVSIDKFFDESMKIQMRAAVEEVVTGDSALEE
jgi:U5 small nuclear ribonucleoprotein component